MAAFVGGLVFGTVARADAAESVELTELTGSLFSLVLWFVFGAGFVLPAFEDLDTRIVLYAFGSLTVVRMVPVALALLGAGQGPRRRRRSSAGSAPRPGLRGVRPARRRGARQHRPPVETAVHTIAVTIVFSIVAHGITARPLATRYVKSQQDTRRRAADPSTPPPSG